MTVNKYKIKVNKIDQDIRIPLQLTFENTGKEDLIKEYEDETLRKLINPTKDFEVTRYNHMGYDCSGGVTYVGDEPIFNAKINYQFYFANGGTWFSQYEAAGWANLEIFKKINSLKNSFFKVDLYDTPYRRNQKLYMSLILTPFSGQEEPLTVVYPDGTTSVEFLKVPNFIFGPNTADIKENFYLYWLKEIVPNLDIFTFYMTAKFFDGRTGEVSKFTSIPQSSAPNTSSLPEEWFYYEVILDHDTKSYKVLTWPNSVYGAVDRVGLVDATTCPATNNRPITWFEYTSPV